MKWIKYTVFRIEENNSYAHYFNCSNHTNDLTRLCAIFPATDTTIYNDRGSMLSACLNNPITTTQWSALRFGILDAAMRRSSPLTLITVLLPSYSWAAQLLQEGAFKNGIAAGITYDYPASFLWTLTQRILPNVPSTSPFDRYTLTWRIWNTMQRACYDPDIAERAFDETLRVWIHQNDEQSHFQLAHQIAATFNRYRLYANEKLAQWLENVAPNTDRFQPHFEHTDDERWQMKLWRFLVDEMMHESNTAKNHHVTNPLQHWVSLLESGTKHPGYEPLRQRIQAALPEELHLWLGLPLPPLYQRAFAALEHAVSITCWQWLPITDTTVMMDWAPAFRQLYHEPWLNQIDDIAKRYTSSSYLQILQTTWSGTPLSSAMPSASPNHQDDSLTFDIYPSIKDEIKQVGNKLIQWLQQQHQVNTEDILLVCKDPSRYAPQMGAIFASLQPTLPFSWHPTLSVRAQHFFQHVINGIAGEWSAESFMAVLRIPTVLSDQKAEPYREIWYRWIKKSGWRIGSDVFSSDYPDAAHHGYRRAIERLLLGIMDSQSQITQPESQASFPQVTTVAATSNTYDDQSNALEALLTVTETLDRLIQYRQTKHTLTDWLQNWQEGISFIAPSFMKDWKHIASAITHQHNSAGDTMFSWSIWQDLLQKALDTLSQDTVSPHHVAKGLRLQALRPDTITPARIIVLLGMESSQNPVDEPLSTFDLTAPDAPWHNTAMDALNFTRLTVLQTIQSAQDKVWISMVKQNDDGLIERPSRIWQELQTHLTHLNIPIVPTLHEEKPLTLPTDHSPSFENTAAESRYSALWSIRLPHSYAPSLLSQLLRDLTHPPKTFLRHKLNALSFVPESPLPVSPLTTLEIWRSPHKMEHIKNLILCLFEHHHIHTPSLSALLDQTVSTYTNTLVARGQVPAGWRAQELAQQCFKPVLKVLLTAPHKEGDVCLDLQQSQQLQRQWQTLSHEVTNLEYESWRLPHLSGEKQALLFSESTRSTRSYDSWEQSASQCWQLWLQHTLINADSPTTHWVLDIDRPECFILPALSPEVAFTDAQIIIDLWTQTQQQLVPFIPQLASHLYSQCNASEVPYKITEKDWGLGIGYYESHRTYRSTWQAGYNIAGVTNQALTLAQTIWEKVEKFKRTRTER